MMNASPQMAKMLAAHDWAATPLGPMADWPQGLRIAVGICMSSRFPMFVWWGPELVNIYNDAYIAVMGDKHPRGFGRPARDSWTEIWDVVGAQAEAVFRGQATWNERVLLTMNRHGYAEDTWFTWSYSPIHDEDGQVAGLFCACYEDTQAVLAERERDRLLGEVTTERTRLVQAFTNSPSFLALLEGPDHVFTFANRRYLELIGRHDIQGRRARDVVTEAESQGFFDILDRVYETGEPFIGTGVQIQLNRTPGGQPETAHLDFVYQPMRDPAGHVNGILAVGVDVTERLRVEARDRFLLTLEDELRLLIEPAEITATAARLLGDHLRVDRCAYAEVSPDQASFDVIGNYHPNLHSIIGHYAMLDFGAEWNRCMLEGVPYVVEDVDTHRPALDDVIGAYHATGIRAVVAVPLRKGGRLVGAMAVHQKTPRRWTPADVEALTHVASRCYESLERARVERTLRESEARFRQLADAMPQIVFAADADGEVDYFNRQWYEYTGVPFGEVGYESWRHVHSPEGLERVMSAWPEAIRTGRPYEIEYPLRRHDGEWRWHLARALPIRDESGRVVRWYGTNTDIHDRKQIEEALAKALESEQHARGQAELASRTKDEFLATLSHELRTPLNAILGWSTMLRRQGATPTQVAQGAEVIERNARAQARIIEDLLDMSAIISGKVRLELETVDLRSIVRAGVETARPTADAKGVSLGERLDAPPGTKLRGDPHRLQQVLWNLLTNAIKFTPRGGRIEVRVAGVDGRVEISVSDTGEGIAREFLPFVFDRFRQADASTTRRHGGLGLGLSIVKQLVELHGGTVRVESAGAGQGSTFTVTLPAKELPAAGPEPVDRRSQLESPEAVTAQDCERLNGLRVLVVDDDVDARDLARRLLESCRADVSTASSSEEALRALSGERFDVLVSDIGMPGEDGYALMRRVRALPAERNGDIPAVALTAYARGEDRLKAIRAGFHVHAAKPVDPAELIAAVANLGGLRARS
jgi:PAS domain S-box-containing protein